MGAILTPEQLEAEVVSCKKALDDLVHEYAICHDMSYSQQSTEQAHVATGPSNVPLALADAHRKLRGELRHASEFLRLMLYGRQKPDRFFGVLDQVDVLRARLEGDEQRHGTEFDQTKFPRTAYRDDIEDAVLAQRQRRGRGDHHSGDQAEVRGKLGLPALEDEFRRGIR